MPTAASLLQPAFQALTKARHQLAHELCLKGRDIDYLAADLHGQRSTYAPPPMLFPWFEHGDLKPEHQDYVHNCMLAARNTVKACFLISAPWRNLERFTDYMWRGFSRDTPGHARAYAVIPGFKIGNATDMHSVYYNSAALDQIVHHIGRIFDICGAALPYFVLEAESALEPFWTQVGDTARITRQRIWDAHQAIHEAFPATQFILYPQCTCQRSATPVADWAHILNNLCDYIHNIQSVMPNAIFTTTQRGFAADSAARPELTIGHDLLSSMATHEPVGSLYYRPCYDWLWSATDADALKYTPHRWTYVWTSWSHYGSLLGQLNSQLHDWHFRRSFRAK